MNVSRTRKVYVVLVIGVLALTGATFAGRWERDRNAAAQNARMADTYALATSSGLVSKRLDAFRLDSAFDCLLYYPPGHPDYVTALELCFDSEGRLVQTIDRRSNPPVIADLQEQPSLAALRVSVPKLLRAFSTVTAAPSWAPWHAEFVAAAHSGGASLPVGFTDVGAMPRLHVRRGHGGR